MNFWKRRRWLAIFAIVALVLPPLWFVTVDQSWFVYDCPRCGLTRDTMEIRFLGQTLFERSRWDYPSNYSRMAADLGVPCEHPNMTRWHKHRYWGLYYCGRPCHNGLSLLTGGEWYDEEVGRKVRAYVATHPEAATEFEQRVLEGRDSEFFWSMVEAMGI